MAASLSSKKSPIHNSVASPKRSDSISGSDSVGLQARVQLIVQKYGGTSVGTPEKIRAVAQSIAQRHQHGDQLVVVVSAMGHTTDELISLAQKISPHPREREMDVLLSVGERISMALLSMALADLGVEAISFTGSQAGIITTESHTRARIVAMKPVRIVEELAKGKVVIVAGFQGVSTSKEITTLGRGGSDTTAVALAKALGATRCEVYTDVDGIYSADPRKVSGAKRYATLPAGVVLEMAVQGAQVMHSRSIELIRCQSELALESQTRGNQRFAVPLWVGQAHGFTDGQDLAQKQAPSLSTNPSTNLKRGTLIMDVAKSVQENMQNVSEMPQVVAVVKRAGLMRYQLKPKNLTDFLGKMSGLIIHDLRISAQGDVVVVLDPTECGQFLTEHQWPRSALQSSELKAEGVASLAVIGSHVQQDSGVALKIAAVFEKIGVKSYELSALSQGVRLWVSDSVDLDLAVSSLHESLVVCQK